MLLCSCLQLYVAAQVHLPVNSCCYTGDCNVMPGATCGADAACGRAAAPHLLSNINRDGHATWPQCYSEPWCSNSSCHCLATRSLTWARKGCNPDAIALYTFWGLRLRHSCAAFFNDHSQIQIRTGKRRCRTMQCQCSICNVLEKCQVVAQTLCPCCWIIEASLPWSASN